MIRPRCAAGLEEVSQPGSSTNTRGRSAQPPSRSPHGHCCWPWPPSSTTTKGRGQRQM